MKVQCIGVGGGTFVSGLAASATPLGMERPLGSFPPAPRNTVPHDLFAAGSVAASGFAVTDRDRAIVGLTSLPKSVTVPSRVLTALVSMASEQCKLASALDATTCALRAAALSQDHRALSSDVDGAAVFGLLSSLPHLVKAVGNSAARSCAHGLLALRDSLLQLSSLEPAAKAHLRAAPAGTPSLFPSDCFDFARWG